LPFTGFSRPLPVISPAEAAPAAATMRPTIAIEATNNRIDLSSLRAQRGYAHRLAWTLTFTPAPSQTPLSNSAIDRHLQGSRSTALTTWTTALITVEQHLADGLVAVVPESIPDAPPIDRVLLQRLRDELPVREVELLEPALV